MLDNFVLASTGPVTCNPLPNHFDKVPEFNYQCLMHRRPPALVVFGKTDQTSSAPGTHFRKVARFSTITCAGERGAHTAMLTDNPSLSCMAKRTAAACSQALPTMGSKMMPMKCLLM
mmetsp:Transcript_172026/g.551413  ORF Transcript_172026/g.551413 Transcript_172026/m.551413 type:complete len:117 (-) Transcript_172026:1035-1385(-)